MSAGRRFNQECVEHSRLLDNRVVQRRWGWCFALLVCMFTPVAVAQEQFLLETGGWAKQKTVDPATPEGQLQSVRRALARDDPDRAFELINQWLEQHPGHLLAPEAHLLRGDCQVAQGEYFKALFDYEQVIRQYPASTQFGVAVEREYQIATVFASGVKRKLLGSRILSAAGEAEEIFIRVQERAPGSEVGELASLALGDFYFDRGQMSSSAEAYELFLANYPESPYAERAMLGLIRASVATFKGPLFDPTGLIEAAQRIKTFQRLFPAAAERFGADALLVRIDESMAVKLLSTAQWYQRRGQRREAIYSFQRVVKDYPQTAAARRAVEQLTAMASPIAVEPAVAGGRGGAGTGMIESEDGS